MEKITLSPSRVKRWVRCKKAYRWRYYEHLVKAKKEVPPTLGIVVGGALAGYYLEPGDIRCQESLNLALSSSIEHNRPEFLEKDNPKPERVKDWDKIVRLSQALLRNYHDWAVEKDNFEVQQVEQSQMIELAPNISLLAIPDAVVISEELPLILEHKVRYRYRSGDFGIDYQSVGCCLVANTIGTLYNVIEYGKLRYHREPIMRSEQELKYFRDIFIHIGEDILATPADRLYPMPFKRCTCEYWELCNAEMQGLDIDDIVSELYRKTTGRPKEIKEPVEEPRNN